MKKVIVASQNPVKIKAVQSAFSAMFSADKFSFETVAVESNVSAQPFTDAETLIGSKNRVTAAVQAIPDADYWVGIEGGVCDENSELEVFAWVVVRNKEQKIGKGRSATFFLPEVIANLVRGGKELGEADDIVFGRTNSKQSNGAVGILTGDVIDRTRYYTEATVCALIPFKNPDLY